MPVRQERAMRRFYRAKGYGSRRIDRIIYGSLNKKRKGRKHGRKR